MWLVSREISLEKWIYFWCLRGFNLQLLDFGNTFPACLHCTELKHLVLNKNSRCIVFLTIRIKLFSTGLSFPTSAFVIRKIHKVEIFVVSICDEYVVIS